MREIKFRIWDKDRKVMANVSNIDFLTGQVQMNGDGNMHSERVSGDKVIFLQYTGLKDKKGVEIYEGDIVRFTNSIDEIYNEVGKVTWEQSECNFVAQYKTANCVTQEENGTTITIYLISNETYRECVEYEVIGNIYENPELLEREGK